MPGQHLGRDQDAAPLGRPGPGDPQVPGARLAVEVRHQLERASGVFAQRLRLGQHPAHGVQVGPGRAAGRQVQRIDDGQHRAGRAERFRHGAEVNGVGE